MRKIGMDILDEAAQRSVDTGAAATRSDLRMVDFIKVGSNSAQVLLQYEPGREAPSLAEIQTWFTTKFGNKIAPKLETARTYQGEPVMTVFASIVAAMRPVADAASMSRIGGLDTYMDGNTNVVWDVTTDEAGHKFLVARTDVDLNALFSRVKTRGHARGITASIAHLREATCCYEAGDTVKFVDHDMVARGVIQSCSGERCTIKANGGTVTVDKGQIIEVVRRAPGAVNEERSKLKDFFAKAYGDPSFADKLTDTMSSDIVGPLKV